MERVIPAEIVEAEPAARRGRQGVAGNLEDRSGLRARLAGVDEDEGLAAARGEEHGHPVGAGIEEHDLGLGAEPGGLEPAHHLDAGAVVAPVEVAAADDRDPRRRAVQIRHRRHHHPGLTGNDSSGKSHHLRWVRKYMQFMQQCWSFADRVIEKPTDDQLRLHVAALDAAELDEDLVPFPVGLGDRLDPGRQAVGEDVVDVAEERRLGVGAAHVRHAVRKRASSSPVLRVVGVHGADQARVVGAADVADLDRIVRVGDRRCRSAPPRSGRALRRLRAARRSRSSAR